MLRIPILIISFIVFSTNVCSQNACPIILIHGFLGWGRDEMAGYYYWGGQTDLEEILRKAGHEVFTVSVGPISPNFDRAIEAFYQIKGGQVDYGNEKAKRLGIIQRPKTKNYIGLYPVWDADHPIHIISHSQGGQTARMLEVLLKKSIDDESSPLLSTENRGWIKSITTISTPHNGTTLVPIMLDIFPFALNLAPWFGGINFENIETLFNFDLEQWGVEKHPDESLVEYYNRLNNSPLSESRNLSTWDLSPAGAAEFNELYKTDPDVYYFSFSTYATNTEKQKYTHTPDSHMSFHLWSTSHIMGKSNSIPNSTWYENDGICNTVSMSHPAGSPNIIYDGVAKKGIWQIVEKLHLDHQAVIGHNITKNKFNKVIALYNIHANLLSSLK